MPDLVVDIRNDMEAFAEAVARKVVAMLIGAAEHASPNCQAKSGLRPYDALKYYDAIRQARKGNNRPLQEYLKQYMPKPL